LHEVADELGLHYMTVYKYVRTGRLVASRDGHEWSVRRADLDRFVRRPAPSRARGARRDLPTRLQARLVAGDEAGAWAVVEAALASGAEPVEVLLDGIGVALRSIGEDWSAGRIDVADEHRASALATRLVGRLGPRFVRPGRKRGTVVVGSPSGDTHALPVAIAADVLRAAGWNVVDLGADLPVASFVHAASAHADTLRVVAVSLTTLDDDRLVLRLVKALRRAVPGVAVVVGGAAVADAAHAARLGSDGYVHGDARALAQVLDELTSAGRA
jgi:excisionase family DNA binding protein